MHLTAPTRRILAWTTALFIAAVIVQRASSSRKNAPAASPARSLQEATNAFLASLSADKRARAVLPFNDDERLNWHFVPRVRKGVPFKEMSPAQQKAALALLGAGLSAQGYRKAETIRQLEPILREREGGNPGRDPELFYFTVFGEPSEKGVWGWRYEGHHISLNWTIINGKVIADSPQFFGANPARVLSGKMQGTRALAAEEDLGRALVKSLDDAQKAEAILSERAPRDILTGAQRQAAIQEDKGIAYRRLRKEQQGMLLALIRQHASAQPPALAEQRLGKIRKAGLDDVRFAWLGGTEPGQGHYYRIQGSTFLVEYDNTQNNANHIHTVWRDFKGDFGADLLANHYKASPHSHSPAPK